MAKAVPEMVYPRGTGAEAHLGCHPNASLKACSSTVGGYSNYGTAIEPWPMEPCLCGDLLQCFFFDSTSMRSLQKRWPVRRMKTSSSVGLLTEMDSISPGNASTISVAKR